MSHASWCDLRRILKLSDSDSPNLKILLDLDSILEPVTQKVRNVHTIRSTIEPTRTLRAVYTDNTRNQHSPRNWIAASFCSSAVFLFPVFFHLSSQPRPASCSRVDPFLLLIEIPTHANHNGHPRVTWKGT